MAETYQQLAILLIALVKAVTQERFQDISTKKTTCKSTRRSSQDYIKTI
jgi:hypothetical protein